MHPIVRRGSQEVTAVRLFTAGTLLEGNEAAGKEEEETAKVARGSTSEIKRADEEGMEMAKRKRPQSSHPEAATRSGQGHVYGRNGRDWRSGTLLGRGSCCAWGGY